MTSAKHFKGLLEGSILTLTFAMLGMLVGMLAAFQGAWTWQWPLSMVLLEAAFLGWAMRCFGSLHAAAARLACILKVQLHAAGQIVLALLWLVLAVMVVEASTNGFAGKNWSQYVSAAVLGQLAGGIVKAAVVASVGLAWARLHLLAVHKLPFDDLVSGAFYARLLQLPVDVATAEKSLERLLERLSAHSAPRFSRYLVNADVAVRKSGAGGAPRFELRWSYLPCMAIMTLHAPRPGVTELGLQYRLRGGFYLSELMLNVVDVFALNNFLRLHVMAPLQSEAKLDLARSRHEQLRDQALEAQLRMLQAQIEPHFLFNTLANVRHLYRSSAAEGEQMLDHLITYLRATLEELRADGSTVGREMDLALHYLAIMKIRMGTRLSYRFTLPDSLVDAPFPAAMLISLVENAIKHGLHERDDGLLELEARSEGDTLYLAVRDNGAGLSSVGGTGVGLSNIRQRLEAMHGNHARLEVGALADGGFIAQIVLPLRQTAAVAAVAGAA